MLTMSKFNENDQCSAIWLDAFNRSTLVNCLLCKACQWFAKVYKRRSVQPTIRHSFISSTSFVYCYFHKPDLIVLNASPALWSSCVCVWLEVLKSDIMRKWGHCISCPHLIRRRPQTTRHQVHTLQSRLPQLHQLSLVCHLYLNPLLRHVL